MIFTGKIQPPYVNKLHSSTHIDDEMYWKLELKPVQDVILTENDWPEGKMGLAKHQVISIPNGSTQVYHKVQVTTDQRGQKVIKSVQIYRKVYIAIRG